MPPDQLRQLVDLIADADARFFQMPHHGRQQGGKIGRANLDLMMNGAQVGREIARVLPLVEMLL